jgi:hypothetical protein
MDASSPQNNVVRFLKTPRGYVYTAALVLCVIRYFLIFTLFPLFSASQRLFFSFASFAFIIVVWESVHAFNGYMNRRMPFEKNPLRRFLIQVGCCLLVILPLQAAATVYFADYYNDYLSAEFGNAVKTASFFLNIFMVLAVNTAYFGFYFFDKWKKNLIEKETWEKEKALLQKERLNAQYENLKNQLNPHFLFNSLTSLNSLIHEDRQLASQFLQQLSRVFRYVLENRDKELVTLETELTFINRYVFLLKTRFEDYFSVNFNIAPQAQARHIVPVTLQVLIENVVKHNSINEENSLRIDVYTKGDYLIVSNNRNPKTLVETSNRMGLENMKALYGYLSDNSIEVIEADREFTVKLPLL